MSQEEMLQEERRADIEWEAMCNCIPGRYEWKQAKLKREADEERHRAHKEFIDTFRRNDAADAKNLDILMQYAYKHDEEQEEQNQISVNEEEDDPRPLTIEEEY